MSCGDPKCSSTRRACWAVMAPSLSRRQFVDANVQQGLVLPSERGAFEVFGGAGGADREALGTQPGSGLQYLSRHLSQVLLRGWRYHEARWHREPGGGEAREVGRLRPELGSTEVRRLREGDYWWGG